MGTIHTNDPDNSAQFDVVNLRRSGEYKVRLFTTEFVETASFLHYLEQQRIL